MKMKPDSSALIKSARQALAKDVDLLLSHVPREQMAGIRDALRAQVIESSEQYGTFAVSIQHVALCVAGADSAFRELMIPPKRGGLRGIDRPRMKLVRELSLYLHRLDRRKR